MSSRFRSPWSSRAVMCVVGGAAVATLSGVLTAPGAMAKPCYGDCTPGVVRVGAGVLRYDAPVGVADQINVTADGQFVTVTDTGVTFSAGTGCTMVTPSQARCPAAGVFSMRIRGLDGNDAITNATSLPSTLMGGDGNDRLTGGSADDELVGEFGADVMVGGAGDDTASYSDTAARTAGVHASLNGATGDDGGAEDGPVGARDTIAADVENLEGTIRDDVLIGNTGPNVINGEGGHDTVQGLGGNDQLTGRGGGTVDGGAGTDQCTSDLRGLLEQPDTFVGCEVTQILN